MPSSAVAICCRALDFLGMAPIVSLDDGTTPANLCKRNFPMARDAVLRGYAWNCATRRARLASLAQTPEWGFAFQYQLPPDCVRVVNVRDDVLYNITWRVEGRSILTDAAGPLDVRYVARPDDAAALDDLLAEAVAARLAADIAFAATSNATRAADMARLAEARLAEARRIDALEASQDDAAVADDWLMARL